MLIWLPLVAYQTPMLVTIDFPFSLPADEVNAPDGVGIDEETKKNLMKQKMQVSNTYSVV